MFVYLTIENFRSVKEKSTLNLSASGSSNHLTTHIYKNDGMNVGTLMSAGEGANKQVISSQADSLIKISRIWADFF
ncbi:hypothetical protein ACWP77_005521, partial [Klebsiella pneumoniae]